MTHELPEINPDLNLDLAHSRTLTNHAEATADIVIPAHNEESTIVQVVNEAQRALTRLKMPNGTVIVSASGCTDGTAERAQNAGARVILSPAGKGAAMLEGIAQSQADIVCLIDGDLEYFGDRPLAEELITPIVRGVAEATIADLYWRPVYPQLWMKGFFAPLAGRLFPELLPTTGMAPWSGQRAALRNLWPTHLPEGFTSDLAILLHWNDIGARLRPVAADDWVNPQRPKPDLMSAECEFLLEHALLKGRITPKEAERFREWFTKAHNLMAEYDPAQHDPGEFENELLHKSLSLLP